VVSSGGVVSSNADAVLIQFQNLMSRFLDTQKQVMMTYLQNGSNAQLIQQAASVSDQGASSIPITTEPSLLAVPPPMTEQDPVSPSPQQSLQQEESALPVAVEAVLDQKWLTNILLTVVADRTGYPKEMLGFDLNLEADLGIDSIKRVEILGAFRRQLGVKKERQLSQSMEQFTGVKTLREIIAVAADLLSTETAPVPAPPAPAPHMNGNGSKPDPIVSVVPRFLLRAVERPLKKEAISTVSGCRLLITDDGGGIADSLGKMLTLAGAEIIIVAHGSGLKQTDDYRYEANLGDPLSVEAMIQEIRRSHGSIAGMVHLLSLRKRDSFNALAFDGWRDCVRVEVKSLSYLVKAAAVDLKAAGHSGSAFVIGATAMGNVFGTAGTAPVLSPHHGGIVGLVKVLALEWPDVLCKVIDLDLSDTAPALASES
jgi:acyl carrier protein